MARIGQPATEESILYGEINLNDAAGELCEKVFHNYADAILKTLKILDVATLDMVADWMVKAKRIDFYGQSSSALVAMNAANRFLRIGVRTMVYDQARTQESRVFLQRFENSDDFRIVGEVFSDLDLTKSLISGRARVGIKIQGFEGGAMGLVKCRHNRR
jgi:hypothetical protein